MRMNKTEKMLQDLEAYILSARKTERVIYTNSEEMKTAL